MSHKWSTFVFWVLGLIALVVTKSYFEKSIKQFADDMISPLPEIWFNTTVPFLFALYFSLLFVKKWSFEMNAPIFLCVSVPCLILSFYAPIVYTFVSITSTSSSYSVPIPSWMLSLNSDGIVSIVAGLTLIMALFGATQSSRS